MGFTCDDKGTRIYGTRYTHTERLTDTEYQQLRARGDRKDEFTHMPNGDWELQVDICEDAYEKLGERKWQLYTPVQPPWSTWTVTLPRTLTLSRLKSRSEQGYKLHLSFTLY